MSKLNALRPQVDSILVVDDEPDILESLETFFQASIPGVRVITASSGNDALHRLREVTPDLIISDYRMPGMDGLEFLTKANELAPDVPRILVTAFPSLNVAMRAINEAAITSFFTKPLKPDQILQAVNAAIIKTRARRRPAVPTDPTPVAREPSPQS